MRLYDISVPLSPNLPAYAGDPPIEFQPWTQLATGDSYNLTRVSLGSHSGTHIDAPSHFLPNAPGIEAIDLSTCIGPALVIDLCGCGLRPLEPDDLEPALPAGTQRLLLKTANSALWRLPQPPRNVASLTPPAAELLIERGVALAGIDYLSVAPASDPGTVHRLLLGAGIIILEGLDLNAVPAGRYTLLCPPLRFDGLDGAPVRALLIADGEGG